MRLLSIALVLAGVLGGLAVLLGWCTRRRRVAMVLVVGKRTIPITRATTSKELAGKIRQAMRDEG